MCLSMKWLFGKSYFTSKETFQKLSANFITSDGAEHYTGCQWRWIRSSALVCGGAEYIMLHIKEDGYLKDDVGTYYPIQNIISIKWNVEGEVAMEFDTHNDNIWFTDEDIKNWRQ